MQLYFYLVEKQRIEINIQIESYSNFFHYTTLTLKKKNHPQPDTTSRQMQLILNVQ
jgi:hypothetical protein